MAVFEEHLRKKYGDWMQVLSSIDQTAVNALLNKPLLVRSIPLNQLVSSVGASRIALFRHGSLSLHCRAGYFHSLFWRRSCFLC